eukprot:7253792-Pyramimonas_sp.AAC.1
MAREKVYDAHRLARLVAGTCRGPRGRHYSKVPTSRASAMDWISKFQKEGPEGGAEARALLRCAAPLRAVGFWRQPFTENIIGNNDHQPSLLEWTGANDDEMIDYQAAHEHALHDVEKLHRAIKKLPSWRSTPDWSASGDLLRVLAMPNWHYKKQHRAGLRAAADPPAPEREPVSQQATTTGRGATVFQRGHLLHDEAAPLREDHAATSADGLSRSASTPTRWGAADQEFADPLEDLVHDSGVAAPRAAAQREHSSSPTEGAEDSTEATMELQAPVFEKCLYLLCRTARQEGRVPAVWHQAQRCRLPKHNDKENTAGERPIMIFCGLGRSYYRSIMDPKACFPYWAHGGISHRRREDATMVQMCVSARLRRAGVRHITRYAMPAMRSIVYTN